MNAPLPSLVPLATLAPGSRCRVMAVAGEGGIRRRLLEMGLCTGVEVAVLRRAPLGDPVELRLRGYLLSLRRDQAALILVTVLDGDALRASA